MTLRPILLLTGALVLSAAVFAAAITKVGGAGKTAVGGSGKTKVDAPSGGSPAWVEHFAEASIDGGVNVNGARVYTTVNVSLTAGTVSKLKFKITGFNSATDVKIMLYGAADALLGWGQVSATATGVFEANITPVAVAAANYKISVAGNGNSDDITFGVLSGQASGATYENSDLSWAALPEDPAPNNDGNLTVKVWAAAYITP